jgi:hypothetical protein
MIKVSLLNSSNQKKMKSMTKTKRMMMTSITMKSQREEISKQITERLNIIQSLKKRKTMIHNGLLAILRQKTLELKVKI